MRTTLLFVVLAIAGYFAIAGGFVQLPGAEDSQAVSSEPVYYEPYRPRAVDVLLGDPHPRPYVSYLPPVIHVHNGFGHYPWHAVGYDRTTITNEAVSHTHRLHHHTSGTFPAHPLPVIR